MKPGLYSFTHPLFQNAYVPNGDFAFRCFLGDGSDGDVCHSDSITDADVERWLAEEQWIEEDA